MSWLPWRREAAVGALLLAACGEPGPTTPRPRDLVIGVQGGDAQLGGPSAPVERPLQVVVRDVTKHAPVAGVTITWQVVEGAGALVTPSSTTDSTGVAQARLTLGPALGTYRVQATFQGNITPPAEFSARAVTAATISAVSPATASAGDTITLSGENFSPGAQDDVVLFDGVRGVVASATDTRLRVVVPPCIPTRPDVKVVVRIGPLASAPATLSVTGSGVPAPSLEPGQVVTTADPAALACARLPAGSAGATYLVVVQNATSVADRPMPFQLVGLVAGTGTTSAPVAPRAARRGVTRDAAADWELRLRERERRLARSAAVAPVPGPSANSLQPPQLGDTRTFNVVNDKNGFTPVTAVIRAITARAILYEDRNAPANGLTAADYDHFGRLFDDPIYATDTSVFGQPSDIDGNGKVIMLFTPEVNRLTPAGSSSFIAGFFYGCDLLGVRDCSGTNRGEVFYALVPDPTGKFGLAQPKSRVLETVPPILAHEFMHMIHFNQRVLVRSAPDESLWLAEALAHAAEDTVGGVFLARADTSTALTFKAANWNRAFRYLQGPPGASLLAFESPGTLEERGAGWLFVDYLLGRFGGSLLGRLTQTSLASTANIGQQTGVAWNLLVNDWAVALYADDLGTPVVDARYTFPNFDLRRTLGQPAFGGTFPLKPVRPRFGDFLLSDTVLSGTAAYVLLELPPGAAPLALGFAGPNGGAFAAGTAPQLAILRLQ
ncbi:MAG TPA: IPT/TIG domain-containing protein [Longimicrobiales bacterium]|nr:IPT/TIG domain-containing protein [Longimicrobiales bacterium]